MMQRRYGVSFLILLGVLSLSPHHFVTSQQQQQLACNPDNPLEGDVFCSETLRHGATCDPQRRVCTSPFQHGCLYSKLGAVFADKRVCNSHDDDSSTFCIPTQFPSYTEVRIHAGHYVDSSLALAWIYQILLSELLQVPVRVVSASHGDEFSFYDAWHGFPTEGSSSVEEVQVETAFAKNALLAASQVGDCEDYGNSTCLHVIPQVWQGINWERGDLSPSTTSIMGSGVWGQVGLFVPQLTAQRYPAVTSIYGLQQHTPQELARIFRQPYTWGYYCQTVSPTGCQEPDGIAERAPNSSDEAFQFFDDQLYKGYIGGNPTMGHVFAPTCEWNNHVEAQLYWHNVSLSSQGPLIPNGGYETRHMMEIWKAANASRANVMMWWWTPDSFIETFADTDYAFVPVWMPPATRECLNSRTSTLERCLPNATTDRYGSKEGSCGDVVHELPKIVVSSLAEDLDDVDPIDQSPAYDLPRNVRLTNDQIQSILKRWGNLRSENSDAADTNIDNALAPLGYQARESLCTWVAENLDELKVFIPDGYPRTLGGTGEEEWTNVASLKAALVMGGLAALIVMVTGIATVHFQRKLAIVYAQPHFVWQVLMGFWLVSMAAIVYGKAPSDGRCLLGAWLTTLGMTLVLVPLVVKIATINHIAQSMRKQQQQAYQQQQFGGGATTHSSIMTRTIIHISPMKMFLVELALTICVLMYLMVWTAYDPPSKAETRALTEDNVVETTIQCASNSDGWETATLCWQGVLLVCATVLAILSEQVVEDFKESRALGLIIYCQDVFLLMRVILYTQRGTMDASSYSATLSFFLSFDALLSSGIYFVPIFASIATAVSAAEDRSVASVASSRRSSRSRSRRRHHAAAHRDINFVAAAGAPPTPPPPPLRAQISAGMASASSADISVMIRNRLREAAAQSGFVPARGGAGRDDDDDDDDEGSTSEPITAECSRSVAAERSS